MLFKFNVRSKYSISLIRKWTHTGFGYLKRTFGKSFSKRVGRIFSHDWPCSTKIEEAPESEKKRRIKSPTFFSSYRTALRRWYGRFYPTPTTIIYLKEHASKNPSPVRSKPCSSPLISEHHFQIWWFRKKTGCFSI